MNKIQLNKVQQTLEAINISGCIVIFLDDKPSLRLHFSEKFKIQFDVIDNLQTFSDGCHLRALAELDHCDTVTGFGGSCECAADSSFLDEDAKDNFLVECSYDSQKDTSHTRHVPESAVVKIEDIQAFPEVSPKNDTSSKDPAENKNGSKKDNIRDGKNDQTLHAATNSNQDSNTIQPSIAVEIKREVAGDFRSEENHSALHLKCSNCRMAFPSKASMAAHNRVPKCIKRCKKCEEDFLCSADLFLHQFQKYDSNFMLQEYPLLPIIKKSDCGPSQCPLCKISLQRPRILAKHLQQEHFSDSSYACCVCARTFKTYSLLKSHLKSCFSLSRNERPVSSVSSVKKAESTTAAEVPREEESDAEELEYNDEENNQITVSNAGELDIEIQQKGNVSNIPKAVKTTEEELRHKSFPNSEESDLEIITLPRPNHPHPCSSGITSSTSQPEVVSVANIFKSNFKCSYCHKKFSTFAEKRNHHRVLEFARQCRKCRAKFSCEADLFIHQYKNHDRYCLAEEFPSFSIREQNKSIELQCPICSSYLYSTTMQHHLQAEHCLEKSYSCCLCVSSFRTNSCLQEHLKKHSRGKKRKLTAVDKTYSEEGKKEKKTRSLPPDRMSSNPFDFKQVKKESLFLSQTKKTPEITSKTTQMPVTGTKIHNCRHCGKIFPSLIALHNHKKVPPLEIACPKCQYVFPSQASLVLHNFQVHEKGFHEEMAKGDTTGTKKNLNPLRKTTWGRCPICWKTNNRLVEHIALKHTGEKLYQCCVCGEKSGACNKLRRHCDKHLTDRKGKIKCSKCSFETNSHADFFRHTTIHRSQCEFCKTDFGHVHLLWSHYESEHADELFTCELCGKKKATRVELENHMKNHRFLHAKPCPICGIMIKGNVNKHFKRKHPDQLEQTVNNPLTSVTGSESNDGGETSTVHQPNKHFSCPKCKKTGFSHQSLMQHLKSKSCNRLPCPSCNRTFTTPDILTKHIDAVHLNITKHVCEICGKKTTNKYNLKVHKRIHSSAKCFFCELCGQGFNYKASLQGHMKSKHKDNQSSSNLNAQ